MIRVVIIHGCPLFRRGLRSLFSEADIQVVGEATNLADAVDAGKRLHPQVVLMEGVQTLSDVELASHIRQIGRCELFVLAPDGTTVEEEFLFHCMRLGAAACELPGIAELELVEKIQRVARGEYLLCSDLLFEPVPKSEPAPKPLDDWRQKEQLLSEQQVRVLTLIMQGLSNKMIAQQLQISEQTVKNHVTDLLTRLHVSDRTGAVVVGLSYGLISLSDAQVSKQLVVREDRRRKKRPVAPSPQEGQVAALV